MERDRLRWASALTILAVGYGAALIAAAALLPASTGESSSASMSSSGAQVVTATQSTSSTLLQDNGPWVLLAVGMPLLIAIIVAVALRRRRLHSGRSSGYLAWSAIGVLAAFCLLALLSIGVFVAPVVGLLAVATSLMPAAAEPPVSVNPVLRPSPAASSRDPSA
jgi:uncharacterized membrane protein YhaH (DUF805 family)